MAGRVGGRTDGRSATVASATRAATRFLASPRLASPRPAPPRPAPARPGRSGNPAREGEEGRGRVREGKRTPLPASGLGTVRCRLLGTGSQTQATTEVDFDSRGPVRPQPQSPPWGPEGVSEGICFLALECLLGPAGRRDTAPPRSWGSSLAPGILTLREVPEDQVRWLGDSSQSRPPHTVGP